MHYYQGSQPEHGSKKTYYLNEHKVFIRSKGVKRATRVAPDLPKKQDMKDRRSLSVVRVANHSHYSRNPSPQVTNKSSSSIRRSYSISNIGKKDSPDHNK